MWNGNDFLVAVFLVFIIFFSVFFAVNLSCSNGKDCRTEEQKLKEASTSAQTQDVCKQYETTAFKDVPIKCLQVFEVGTRK